MTDFPADKIISALVTLLVGTLLGKEITRFLYRPKVIVRYKKLSPLKDEHGIFWSIKVVNLGRTVASNCIGTISLFDVKKNDVMETYDAEPLESLPEYKEEGIDLDFPRFQMVTPGYFREIQSEPLCWAQLGNPHCIDINPGMIQQLDVCKVYNKDGKKYFIFPTEFGWRKIRVRIKASEIFGRISICPSNEFPTQINFKVIIDPDGSPQFKSLSLSWKEYLKKFLFKGRYYYE